METIENMVQSIQKTGIMKANELRIGNYYNQFGNIYQANGTVISQLEIAPKDQLWCKPIPLTEEWLLKMGLEEGNRGYYLKRNVVISVEGEVYFGDSDTWIASIYYVHQLQNLYFALEGEELTLTES